MAVIPGGAGRAYGRAAPPRKGIALMRRHRREGGVQCRAGSTRRRQRGSASPPGGNPGPRVRLKATIRPKTLRGAVRSRSKKPKVAVPIAPQPLDEQSLERKAAAGMKV